MRIVIYLCLVLLVGFQSKTWGQKDQRPKLDESLKWTDLAGEIYDFESIRDQFRSCEAVITGTFEGRAPYTKNGTGVARQYFLRFKDDFQSLHGGFHSFQDGGQNWHAGVYQTDESNKSQLKRMNPEVAYAIFFPKKFDEDRAICIPADKGLMACIKTWKKYGWRRPEELEALKEKADWIVEARCTSAYSLESYPSENYWQFEVTKAVKGKGVPKSMEIHGSYRSYAEIPFPLKSFAKSFTLYLKKDAKKDSDVLANVPLANVPTQD